ncbi:GDSL-type esterase/lipase family protein [Bacillus sp. JJ1122]|uniref:SGNH/GDSL hydrolase family protein n=1 Tax=Bacillus sp. JJ1122 TaxID=3122951 RepID=UPI0030004F3B
MDFLLFGTLALLLLVVAGVIVFYQRKNKLKQLPANHPEAFLKNGMRDEGKKLVAVIGGDVVHGNISYNFVEDASKRKGCVDYQFINDGINGSTAYDVLQRLDRVIACHPEFIIIMVGLNDASAKIAPDIAKRNIKIQEQFEKPSLLVYEKNLAQIVNRLKTETTAKIALFSLPVAGENLFSKANKEIDQYNEVIKKIAEISNVSYLPFNEKLKAYLKGKGHTRGRSLKNGSKMLEKAIIQHFVYGYSLDRIAQQNGFLLLTDGMHLNSTSGMMAAHQIELFLKKNELKAIQ